jgi:hypothetical protein
MKTLCLSPPLAGTAAPAGLRRQPGASPVTAAASRQNARAGCRWPGHQDDLFGGVLEHQLGGLKAGDPGRDPAATSEDVVPPRTSADVREELDA